MNCSPPVNSRRVGSIEVFLELVQVQFKAYATCSDDVVGGNMPLTRAWSEVYDFVSTRRFTTTSPYKYEHLMSFGATK